MSDRVELAEALAIEREIRDRSRAVRRASALRLRRLCPEMSDKAIADRVGTCDRTVARWLAEAERRS